MSRSIKGLPPRVRLREMDSATGSYPTIARTGDRRSGVYNVFFDDQATINFSAVGGANTKPHPDHQGIPGSGQYTAPLTDLSVSSVAYVAGNALAHFRFLPNNEHTSSINPEKIHGSFQDADASAGPPFVDDLLKFTKNTPFVESKQAPVFPGINGAGVTFKLAEGALVSVPLNFGNGASDRPFSVMAWIKMRDSQKFAIFSKITGPIPLNLEWFFGMSNVGAGKGRLQLQLYDNSPAVARSKTTLFDMSRFHDKWIHVAATYDGRGGDGTASDVTTQGIHLYINGGRVPDSKLTTANLGSYTAMHDTGAEAHIGFKPAGPQSFADGAITEVAVFDKELTQDEIRNIMGFKSGISYPSLLEANSRFITQDLTSSIALAGSPVKGVSDRFAHFSPGQELTPFIEDSLFEQNQTSSFYLIGSDPTKTGLGFSSPLKSKTQIRLRLPVGEQTTLSPLTASMYYFNSTAGRWEWIREDLARPPLAGEGTANLGSAREANLFTAFGTPTVSSSVETDRPQSGSTFIYAFTEVGTWLGLNSPGITRALAIPRELYRPFFSQSAPNLFVKVPGRTYGDFNAVQTLDSRYAASDDQVIDLNQLQHPFLVEKVVAKIPLAAGSGWFNDKTTIEFGKNALSIGGPCLTFALQRQASADVREIIMSATIIPEGDNFTGFLTPELFEASGTGVHKLPQGFLSFSTPNAVISGDPITKSLTGSVQVANVAEVSNGGFTIGLVSGTVENPASSWFIGETFSGDDATLPPSFFVSINPFGRSLRGKAGGRSFFGKEYITPGKNVLPSHPDPDPSIPSYYRYYNGNQGAASPYVLLPGDKLIVSLAKHRPVHSASALTLPNVIGGVLTGSHDVTLTTGSLDITLYGSLLREGTEFHDTLNQPLNSDAIHEAIHSDNPVVDQFDTNEREQLSGSYVDHIIVGAMSVLSTSTGFHANPEGRKTTGYGSRRRFQTGFSGQINTLQFQHVTPAPGLDDRRDVGEVTGSLFRGVRLTSLSERYFDSLLPRPDQINAINGGTVLRANKTSEIGYLQVGTNPGWGAGNISTVDDTWYRSYPFEARYSSVQRTADPFRQIQCDKVRDTSASPLPDSDFVAQIVGIMETTSSVATDADTIFKVIDDGNQSDSTKMLKTYYGMGDGHDNSAEIVAGIGFSLSTPNGKLSSFTDVRVRGWKYGLINGRDHHSSVVFRRDRYGQLRDMLEQRQDTKFRITAFSPNGNIGLTTIGSSPVKAVFSEPEPEDTFSSNMSLEATSSLPFFDADRGDEGRNRGPLPDTNVVEP